MTNKEKYRKAFSTLHASDNISLEAENMEKRIHAYRMKKAAAACAAVMVVCGSMTVAYAADFGGIQQKMMTWFHGEQTQIDVRRTGEHSYSYSYTDENGKVRQGGTAAIGVDENGRETVLPAEEVLEGIGNGLEVMQDGSVWYYYNDKKFDLTDLIDPQGNCKFQFQYKDETLYVSCSIQQSEEGMIDEKNGISYTSGHETSIAKEAPQDAKDYILVE